jgi:hypothetical protein
MAKSRSRRDLKERVMISNLERDSLDPDCTKYSEAI